MIQAEVEAREMSDTMKIQEKEGTETTPTPKRGLSPGTANSLLARSGDGSGIRCAFCNDEHYSSACEEVKEIQKRKNILRRDKRFFLFFVFVFFVFVSGSSCKLVYPEEKV